MVGFALIELLYGKQDKLSVWQHQNHEDDLTMTNMAGC